MKSPITHHSPGPVSSQYGLSNHQCPDMPCFAPLLGAATSAALAAATCFQRLLTATRTSGRDVPAYTR